MSCAIRKALRRTGRLEGIRLGHRSSRAYHDEHEFRGSQKLSPPTLGLRNDNSRGLLNWQTASKIIHDCGAGLPCTNAAALGIWSHVRPSSIRPLLSFARRPLLKEERHLASWYDLSQEDVLNAVAFEEDRRLDSTTVVNEYETLNDVMANSFLSAPCGK